MIIKDLQKKDKGALKATFTLVLPKWANFTIHNMSFFESGPKRWVNFPGYSYEKDDKKKFFAYCRFEDRTNQDAFQREVLKLLDEAMQTGAKPPVDMQDDLPF